MLELFKKNDVLFVKALMQLRLPIKYQNKVFGKEEQTILLLPEEVNFILARNGNIRLWNGKKFIKLNLGEFYDIIEKNQFKVVNFVEPKKEQPVQQPKVEQPKKEEVKQNDNKKQRHNNNNKSQNSGGDK